MIDRRARKRLAGTVVGVAVVVAALLFFRGVLTRAFSYAERPLVSIGTLVTDRVITYCESLGATENVAQLKDERDVFALLAADTEQLRDENAQLRDQLAFVQRTGVKAIASAVVQRQISDRAASFVIDRGLRDGIEPGMPVVVGEGILVGKVHTAFDTTSIVTAISDPRTATAVTLLNQTRTLGLAQGMNGVLISILYIPNDQPLATNDLVVTSGLEENMMSGLLVGIVNEVRSDVAAPFQEAVIEPLADVRRFSSVLVVVQTDAL